MPSVQSQHKGGGVSSDAFSTFSGTSNTKPYFLRPYLEGDLSEMVSKLGVLDGAVMKKLIIKKNNNNNNLASERHPSHFCCKS